MTNVVPYRPPREARPVARMIGPSTAELMQLPIKPTRWAVPGILPYDTTLISAAPKAGKSRLAKWAALIIATSEPEPGKVAPKVLYISPDDTNEAGWGQDINELLGGAEFDPNRLVVRFGGIARLGDGLVEQIQLELDADPAIRHVFIDVLNSVKPRKRQSDDIQADEHETMRKLAALQERYDIGLTMLTHDNKRPKQGERAARISGSFGLLGGVPNYICLTRDEVGSGVEFFMRGRYLKTDVLFRFDLNDLALDWAPPQNVQDALSGTLSPEDAAKLLQQEAALALAEREAEEQAQRPHVPGPIEQAILDVLADEAEHTPKQIAEVANLRRVTVRWHLRRMLDRGQLALAYRGMYTIAPTSQTFQTSGDEADTEPGNNGDVGHVGHVGASDTHTRPTSADTGSPAAGDDTGWPDESQAPGAALDTWDGWEPGTNEAPPWGDDYEDGAV